MTVVRAPETRIMEGLRRDFLADADAAAYWLVGEEQTIYVGPLLDHDPSITPPQINISLMPPDSYEPGAGGRAKDLVSILVKCLFPALAQRRFAIGGLNPHDYVRHLENICTAGSIDPVAAPPARNGYGWVLDPDAAPMSDDPTRWLTTAMLEIRRSVSLVLPKSNAVQIAFAATYEIDVDNITRQR